MEHDDERRPDTETAAMSKEDPERTRLGAHLADTEEPDAEVADRPGDRSSFAEEPDRASAAVWSGEPGGTVPSTYTGEEADVTGRPEYADQSEPPADRPLYEDEPYRADRPGGGSPLFADEEDRLDQPLPHEEPGVDRAPYERAADDAKRPRPADEG
ncbi:MAG TPA: hypothetical protein VF880_04055 [Actinomycetes bacterium]|jgi:hypothetical protein